MGILTWPVLLVPVLDLVEATVADEAAVGHRQVRTLRHNCLLHLHHLLTQRNINISQRITVPGTGTYSHSVLSFSVERDPGHDDDCSVLGIRDILVRIRIRWYVPLTNGYCTDPALDPTPDPTSFFSDFKDAKKFSFHIFFYNLPAGTLSSVLKIKFFAKMLSLNFILKALLQSA